MTRYDIRIDALVLHGVPPALAEDLAPAVQQRLAALAAGDALAPAARARTTGDLADRIALAVWQQVGSGGAS